MMKASNLIRKLLAGMLLAIIILPLSLTGAARAQGSTSVLVVPASATALTCTETVVTVRVQDVVDLNAYDMRLSFDPAVIEVIDVTNGGFISPDYRLAKSIDNVAGTLRLSYTQTGKPGRTGSGDLISIRLRAVAGGLTTPLTILSTSRLSALGGVPIPFTPTNGTINTQDCPPAELSVFPATATACVNTNYTLKVRVANVIDLYSYTMNLSFTPGAIQVLNVTNGSFLETGFDEPSNGFNNTAGTISFGMSQQSPAVPRTGSGDLISITYRAVSPGQVVNMVINEGSSVLVNWPDVQPIPYNATDGVITTDDCIGTAIDLLYFTATPAEKSVILNWETASEVDNVGFNLYRAERPGGKRIKLNREMIPSLAPPGSTFGAVYEYTDAGLKNNRTYTYWLEDVDMYGKTSLHDPVQAAALAGQVKPTREPKPARNMPPIKRK